MNQTGQKHVVLAWELGDGYGHILGFLPIIDALLAAHYKVSFISRNVVSTHRLLANRPVDIFQAPMYRTQQQSVLPATLNYSDLLYDLGYRDAGDLTSLVNAWTKLFELIEPHIVIADHSPTAILAAKCSRIQIVDYGTGFFIPPQLAHFPLFGKVTNDEQLAINARENLVLCCINEVLTQNGLSEWSQVSTLFSDTPHFLCTLNESDHYRHTRPQHNVNYIGPRFDIVTGTKHRFTLNKKRIFAYLKEFSQGFAALLNALENSGEEVIMHVPNASTALKEHAAGLSNLSLSAKPVHIKHILQQANMVICHGGHGLVSASLLAGVPLLLVPSQLEQSILTQLLSEQHLVAAVNPAAPNVNYAAAIQFVLENDALRRKVKAFKRKYAGFSVAKRNSYIVEKIREYVV